MDLGNHCRHGEGFFLVNRDACIIVLVSDSVFDFVGRVGICSVAWVEV